MPWNGITYPFAFKGMTVFFQASFNPTQYQIRLQFHFHRFVWWGHFQILFQCSIWSLQLPLQENWENYLFLINLCHENENLTHEQPKKKNTDEWCHALYIHVCLTLQSRSSSWMILHVCHTSQWQGAVLQRDLNFKTLNFRITPLVS